LLLPEPIVLLLSAGAWDTFILLTRWHRHLKVEVDHRRVKNIPGPIGDWPEPNSAAFINIGQHRAAADSTNNDGMVMSSESCRVLAQGISLLFHELPDESKDSRREQVHQMHTTLTTWQRSLEHGSKDSKQHEKYIHSSRMLLQALKASSLLRGGAVKLVEAVARSLAMVLPEVMQGSFLKFVSEAGDEMMPIDVSLELKEFIPSASLVRRHELSLDIAIILLTRTLKEKHPFGEKFGMADSSPMASFDWIWSQYTEIQKLEIIPTFEAVIKLKLSIESYVARCRESKDEGDEMLTPAELRTVLPEWKPWLDQIKRSLVKHVNIPVAMASGHSSLADKVACETYKLHLATPPANLLADEMATWRSNTSDMGTELGMATFKVNHNDVEKLLPNWVERRSLPDDVEQADVDQELDNDIKYGKALLAGGIAIQSDDDALGPDIGTDISDGELAPDVEVADVDMEAPSATPSATPSRAPELPTAVPTASLGSDYMPNGYTIAGLQHQTNNLNSDSNKAMSHYKVFFSELKQLESLTSSSDRRQTFIWTCIRKSKYANKEAQIEKLASLSLYEARWHEVVAYLKGVAPLMLAITACFSAKRFLFGTDAEGNVNPETIATKKRKEFRAGITEFDAYKLEAALARALFHFYSNMMLELNGIPTHFAKRNEICPCHMALFEGVCSYEIRSVLDYEYLF
jgi:hypothetical protein